MEYLDLRCCAAGTAVWLRSSFWPHLAAAGAVLLLTPVLFSVRSLSAQEAAFPLELAAALCGVILETPIFAAEREEGVRETVLAKYADYGVMCALRCLCALAATLLLIALFVLFLRTQGSDVGMRELTGTLASAVFLGGLGLLTAAGLENGAAAYMVPVLYYAFNYSAGRERLGDFYLFSMMSGGGEGKIVLLSSGLLLAAAGLTVNRIRVKKGAVRR